MASRLLGLVRDQVLAYYFGAGDAMDAFRVAFRVPNLVRDLFAEGAMSAAFVPTFTRVLTQEGRERAWRLASSVINALILMTAILVVLGLVFAEPLVRFYAADFSDVPGKLELTVQLTRVMVPFLTLVAVAAALMGMLNSLGYFFIPALSPATFNVATVLMALAFVPVAPRFGVEPIMIIAFSTLVGGVGQVALQWPVLAREGYRYQPVLDTRDDGLRRVLLLMGPGTFGLAATQINVFVNTMLATGEGTGAVSWLDYAFRLMYLPIGLFGVSIATAATPAIARLVAGGERDRVRSTVASAVGMTLALNVPATLGLIVLAGPIVGLLFEHGSFTAADTAATAAALRFYAIGLIGYSVVRIITPTFYALNKSRIPVAASAMSVLLNVTLNVMLVQVMGYRGLALGTSITALVNALVQLALLGRELDGVEARRILTGFARILVASLLMAAAAWGADQWLGTAVPGHSIGADLARVAGAIAAGLAALVLAAHVLRVTELDEAAGLVLGRLRRMTR